MLRDQTHRSGLQLLERNRPVDYSAGHRPGGEHSQVMHRQRLMPRRQASYQAGHHQRPGQQHASSMADQPGRVRVVAGDTGRYSSLRECSPARGKCDLRHSHYPKPGALSPFNTPVNARHGESASLCWRPAPPSFPTEPPGRTQRASDAAAGKAPCGSDAQHSVSRSVRRPGLAGP